MTPFVLDANTINIFQQERIQMNEGVAHAAMQAIFSISCIAIDDGGLCHNEWISCAGGKVPFALIDWIADQIVAGKIQYFALSDNKIRKELLKIGLPEKDHKWVRLAIGCGGKKIVTEDVDFFDPKMKKAKAEVKQKLKAERSGTCSNSLKRMFGISVMCLFHVPNEACGSSLAV